MSMNFQGARGEVAQTSGRVWRFADFEFDELGRALRVKGRLVDLETKPLDILLQLLWHAGEVVTKEELLESVWPDVMVADGSLATAVSKLRKAMGDEEAAAVATFRGWATGWQCPSIAGRSRQQPGPSLDSSRATRFPDENSGGFLAPWTPQVRAKSG